MRAFVLASVVLAATPAVGPSFRFADDRITEASGIGAGVRSPGVVYVQNDSGDPNRFFAVNAVSGRTAATVTVRGATNVDWEDLAVAPDARGVSSVWLADIGDNEGTRSEVRIYRVTEPRVARADQGIALTLAPSATWRLRYPAGRPDAEALAVGPTGDAYVVTKSPFGRSTVYRVPAQPTARVQVLRPVATIVLGVHGVPNPFGIPGELAITGAALSPDGRVFAVRTYAEAYVWPVEHGDVPAALRQEPVRVNLPREPQGEGIALPDDRTALVDSEGRHSTVSSVALPPLTTATRSPSAPAPTTTSDDNTATARAEVGAHRSASRWPVVAGVSAAVALIALTVLLFRRRRRHAGEDVAAPPPT